VSLLDRILKKRAKRKARAQYAREHRRGQHETECPVCHELKKLRLPQTSHVEPPIK
jgi:hypothetical protein